MKKSFPLYPTIFIIIAVIISSCKRSNIIVPTSTCIQVELSSPAHTDSQTVVLNSPIIPITYIVSGTATFDTTATDTISVSILGSLPTGVTGTFSHGTFTISGTPTSSVGSPFMYRLSITGSNCANTNIVGSITVHDSTSGAGNITDSTIAYAYIPNAYDNTVSIVNTVTDSVVATIPVGRLPYGEAVCTSTKTVYIVNASSSTISVISKATNTVTRTLTLPNAAAGTMAVSPDGTKIYVVSASPKGMVDVINTATNALIDTVFVGGNPLAIAISPDGSKVYVGNNLNETTPSTVSVINTATDTITTAIPIGKTLYNIVVSPDGSKVYVGVMGDGAVDVINAATNTISAAITTNAPIALAMSPDGSKVYVSNTDLGTVSVINTTTNTIGSTIHVGNDPFGISVTPDGSKVYVTSIIDNTASVINTTTNTVIKTIPVGENPYALGNFIIQ